MRIIATGLLALAACASNTSPAGGPDAAALGDARARNDAHVVGVDAPIASGKPTIFTILLENHDYAEVVGSANAPYINSLIASYGLATNYKDTGHPSTPNYLHLISGANQYPGIIDIGPTQVPYFPSAAANLGTQLEAAGIPWRSYQEHEATPCKLTDDGTYAPRHDPFLYFKDQQSGAASLCATTNVPYTAFAADLASDTYKYMWITPDLTDDGHDPSGDPVGALKTTDTWLSTNVPAIIASAAFQAGGVLFITWDEAEGRNADDKDQIPMIIVSRRIKSAGFTSAAAYTHSSYLATVEDLLGLPRLATVTTAPAMLEFLQ